MTIIDGIKIANNIKANIKRQVTKLDRKPGLAVIVVGKDKASLLYVKNKTKACHSVGFYSRQILLNHNVAESELIATINKLNNDNLIDGILVQLPLPQHINPNNIIASIKSGKDVDGFHAINMGLLAQNRSQLRPCTPKGIMTLLASINCNVMGKYCVVVGSSHIVGRPMLLELINAGATVTICNSKTQNLTAITKNAEILIVGIGSPQFIKGHALKKGAIVIDVGINYVNGKLVGDVEFHSAKKYASFITPVPGGVGPMTIATLLENTLIAYNLTNKRNY